MTEFLIGHNPDTIQPNSHSCNQFQDPV